MTRGSPIKMALMTAFEPVVVSLTLTTTGPATDGYKTTEPSRRLVPATV
jgi:hypothetical protein